MRITEQVVNIVGTALLLGLLLRYSGEVVKLVQAGGSEFKDIYATVSLQNVAHPGG
jgi:hypothetical protein